MISTAVWLLSRSKGVAMLLILPPRSDGCASPGVVWPASAHAGLPTLGWPRRGRVLLGLALMSTPAVAAASLQHSRLRPRSHQTAEVRKRAFAQCLRKRRGPAWSHPHFPAIT